MVVIDAVLITAALSAGGIVFAAVCLVNHIKKTVQEKADRDRIARKRLFARSGAALPSWFDSWSRQVEIRMKQSRTGFKLSHYLALTALLMCLAFFVGLFLLKNAVAFGILAATAVVVPEHIIRSRIHSRKNKLLMQLGPAIRLLAAEHAGTAQIDRAIINVADKIDQPLKGVFEKARADILANKDDKDVYANLLDELNFEYGRIFVQSLRIVANDASKRELLWWLAEQIADQIDDVLDEQSTVVGERLMSIAAVAVIFPVLFFMLKYVPETYPFLVEDPTGRAICCLCLAAPLANVFFDRLVNNT